MLLWRSKDARDVGADLRVPRRRGCPDGRPYGRAPRPNLRADRRASCSSTSSRTASATRSPYHVVHGHRQTATDWTPLQEVDQPGWLYWRPKTIDSKTWYVTAYWHEHGKSRLLKSTDGVKWEIVSTIWEGERNDETDFEFYAGRPHPLDSPARGQRQLARRRVRLDATLGRSPAVRGLGSRRRAT